MAWTATFAANFDQWDAAIEGAKKGLDTLQLRTDTVKRQMQTMFSGFDGSRIKVQADIAAGAFDRFVEVQRNAGKAATLSNEEMRKLNATMKEAISTYERLGKDVPAHWRRVETATRGAQQATTGLGATLGSLKTAFAGAFAGFTAANLLGSAVRGIRDMAADIVRLGGEMIDLSARTGVSTTALQRWKYAAEQNGNTIDQITTAVGQLQKRIGGKESATIQALRDLGLSFEVIKRLSPEQQMTAVASAMRNVTDQTKLANMAVDLFGRSGMEILPTLLSDMEKLGDEAERLGIVLSTRTLKAMDEFGDTMDRLGLVGRGVLAEVLGPMVERVNDIAQAYLRASASAESFASTLVRLSSPMVPGLTTAAGAGYAYGQSGFDWRSNVPNVGGPNVMGGLAGAPLTALAPEAAQAMMRLDEKFARQTTATHENTAALKAQTAATLRTLTLPATLVNLSGAFGQQAASLLAPGLLGGAAAGGAAGWGGFSTLFGGTKPPGGWASSLFQPGQVLPPVRSGWSGALPGQGLGVTDIIGQGPGFWGRAFGGAGGFGGGLSQTIMSAFMGGGSVGQGVGGFLAGNVASTLVSGIGGALGSVLGSIVPGLGTMLGGALGGWIGNLFGGAGRTREMRDQWMASVGGLDEVRRMADYANVSIDRLLNTRRPKEFEKEVKKLEAAFAAAQKRVQALVGDLAQVAERGGLVSGSLARRIMADLDKPEVADAFQQFVQQALSGAASGLTAFLQSSLRLPLSTRSAEAFGGALAGIFARMRQLGTPLAEALRQLQPAITALEQRLRAAGVSGGAAFAELRAQAALASDAVAGPLLSGVDELTQAMIDLANSGILTESMFRGLAEQVGVTWDRLIRQGHAGDAALRLMAPSLQRLWELEQKYGWTVDQNTQKLIDRAREQGLVGEHMKSVEEQILAVLKDIAKALGVDIPNAARRTQDAFDRIRPPRWEDFPGTGDGGGGGGGRPGLATGGLVTRYLATGGWAPRGTDVVPAMLTPGEYVMSAPAVQRIGLATLDALNRGQVPGSSMTVNVAISIDTLDTQSVRQAVEQEIAPALVEVLRQNVRGLRTDTQYALGVR